MMNGFTFNGTSTQSLGLLVTALNPYNSATRKVDKFTIPYRNGDLIIDSGTYENIRVGYEISVIRNTMATCDAINDWLSGSQGYCILTDTYNPEIFRVGYMADSIEYVLTALYREGTSTIEFDCLPQKYLVSNQPMTFSSTADTTTDTTMSLSTVPTPLNISLNGNTTQEGSSGKNVFDYKYWADNIPVYNGTKEVNGNSIKITATSNDAYTRYDSLAQYFPTVTPNTDYTLSWNVVSSTGDGEIYIFGADSSVITHMAAINNHYITFNSGSNTVIKFRLGVTNTGKSITFNKLQLEKGSSATTWEPHISPTNPQVIHNVSGDNTINVASFNVWDEEYELGGYGGNGLPSANTDRIRSKNAQPINVLGDTVYYFKSPKTIYIRWYDEYDNFIRSTDALNTTKRSPVTAKYLRFFIDPSYGTTYKNDICINVSNAQKNGTYEPYTRQSYPLYLPVENLFDRTQVPSSLVSWTYYVPNFGDNAKAYPIYIGKGKTATFKSNIPTLTSGNGFYAINALSEGSTNTLNDTHERTISANNSGYVYVGMITNRQYYQEVIDGTYYIQVTVGDVSNVQNYSIELNKIGTRQDYIYKNGGKWYLHKEFNKVDLGTLTWQYSSSYAFFLANITNRKQGSDDMLCTFYPYGGYKNDSGMSTATDKTLYRDGSTSTVIKVKDTSYTDARTFKTAMSGALLYYPLATPTNTEITDTTLINQLNNIEKAYSYDGTTNILQVSNDNGFMLGVVSLHGSTFVSNNRGEPVITVNQTGLLYLNGVAINVTQAPMTINSQTMQCYNGMINLNNYAEMDDFPMIKKGNNTVGSSMTISVVPNYWKL